jgi:hypothetical protein
MSALGKAPVEAWVIVGGLFVLVLVLGGLYGPDRMARGVACSDLPGTHAACHTTTGRTAPGHARALASSQRQPGLGR